MDISGKKDINLGLAILKMLMCFEVICCHFWYEENIQRIFIPFSCLRKIAVPVFMLVSFILVGNSFKEITRNKILRRFKRLCIPHIGWAFIYWIIFAVLSVLFDKQLLHGFYSLFWQIITGHSPEINPAMWYQVDLILITAICYFIFLECRGKKARYVLIGIAFLSLVLQYSGINYRIFSKLRYEIQYPLGRIAEMVPYASIGIIISQKNIYQKMKNYFKGKWINIVFLVCFLLVVFCEKYGKLSLVSGFQYQGIGRIFEAICIVSFCYLAPIKRLSISVKKIILQLTRYTLGIYCMHNLIGKFVIAIYDYYGIQGWNIGMCLLIYIICYFICLLISKIQNVYCKMLIE